MGDDSHTFIVNGEELTNLVVPEGITTIPAYAFYGCTGLTSITFPYPTEWYATTSSTATTGTPMDMSNPEQNAEWLTATSGEDYYGYYFKCNA